MILLQCERPGFTLTQNNTYNYSSVYFNQQNLHWTNTKHFLSLVGFNFLKNAILIRDVCSQIFGQLHTFKEAIAYLYVWYFFLRSVHETWIYVYLFFSMSTFRAYPLLAINKASVFLFIVCVL